MKELIRTKYLQRILPLCGKHVIKILVWQRRIGKTTILRQIRERSEKRVAYINMEDSTFSYLRSDVELSVYLETQVAWGTEELYIDEVQLIRGWEKSINSIFSKYTGVDIFLTGSNSHLLSGELATLLRGRCIEFEIFPFSYAEYCEYFALDTGHDSWMSFHEHGNSPTNYMTDDPLFRLEWKKNLINTIFLKDIIERHSIKDAFLLEEVFLFCVNNISNNTNLTNILNALKSHGIITNLTTLGSYLSYLRDAYLLYEVGLYDVQGKKVFNRERKYYLGDPTYRRVLFSGYDAGAGKILENLIYLEAHSRWYRVSVGRIGDKEVDFVLEKNGKKIYIQAAYILTDETVIEREFGNLKLIRDSWPKYVVSLDEIYFGVIDGIEHIRAWEIEKIFE